MNVFDSAVSAMQEELYRDGLYSHISDVHKEIYGIRPRWINPAERTTSELEAILAGLYRESEAEFARERSEREADELAQAHYRLPIPASTLGEIARSH